MFYKDDNFLVKFFSFLSLLKSRNYSINIQNRKRKMIEKLF